MLQQLKTASGWVTTVSGLALLWYGLVLANAELFRSLELSRNAALIYLPAALRIVYPLVFGRAGVCGVIVGSYFGFPTEAADSMGGNAALAILSGVVPLIGIGLFTLLYKTRADLADLRPVHLVALALLCAAANAVILNLYLAVSGEVVKPLRHILTIFIGDVLGAAIVLYLTSFVLIFFISRRRA